MLIWFLVYSNCYCNFSPLFDIFAKIHFLIGFFDCISYTVSLLRIAFVTFWSLDKVNVYVSTFKILHQFFSPKFDIFQNIYFFQKFGGILEFLKWPSQKIFTLWVNFLMTLDNLVM